MTSSITGQGISAYPAPDDELSSTSKNSVQNKVVDEEITDLKTDINRLDAYKAPTIHNTVSGEIVTFDDGADGMPVKTLMVAINSVQDLHGYDHPWMGGTGKNLLPKSSNTGPTRSINGITFEFLDDGTITATGTNNGTGSILGLAINLPAGNYYYTVGALPGGSIGVIDGFIWDTTAEARAKKWDGTTSIDSAVADQLYELKIEADHTYMFDLRVANGVTVSNLVFKPMITASTETDATFEPYSNICSISGRNGLEVYREAVYDSEADPIVTINWQSQAGTVYGATVNVVTGLLTVTDAEIASYNGETLPSTWISDRDVYAAGTTPTIGAQVVYKLATPQTYQLDPITVSTLLGNNTIWTNAGPMTVEYPADTTIVVSDVKNAISQNEESIADTQSMIATVEATTTASKNYAVGDLLVYDGKLYKVTSAIATGATIIVGSNVTQTTVETQIASARGGSGETWYTAELSAANYDSTLKMIVFDAGSGKKIKDVIAVGQIVNDGTQTANEEIAFGVGITNGRRVYSCPCVTQGIASSNRRVGFIAQFSVREFTSGSSDYRTIFPQSFYYGVGTPDATAINIDVLMATTGATRATNLYYNFNDPRYFKIELPTWVPQWAYIKLYYTLQ